MGTWRRALRSRLHRLRRAHALAQHAKPVHALRILLDRLRETRCKLAEDLMGSNVVDARQQTWTNSCIPQLGSRVTDVATRPNRVPMTNRAPSCGVLILA